MDPIEQHRARCALDQRSRWWRDGLFGVVVGGLGGSFFFLRGEGSVDPWILVLVCAAAGGVLSALFGARVLYIFS